MRLMSRGNNVQCLDLVARICALHKNRVLLLLLYKFTKQLSFYFVNSSFSSLLFFPSLFSPRLFSCIVMCDLDFKKITQWLYNPC